MRIRPTPRWCAGRCVWAALVVCSATGCSAEQVIGAPAECEATDPRVGWVAQLEPKLHDVSGRATIVNDCTIRVDMFAYDGEGITVNIYGGPDGDYDAGFAMTGDLVRQDAYEDATVYAIVPGAERLADVDGVSVWCADVGVSFGDGLFGPVR